MLNALRCWMKANNIDAYIVPTADPHHDEYIPEYYEIRRRLTGFTGSAGMAVVTRDSALLWTDSRYWLQAAEELSAAGFTLMKDGDSSTPYYIEWIVDWAKQGGMKPCRTAFPLEMITIAEGREMSEAGLSLVPADPFDKWWLERPALPSGPIVLQDTRYVGRSRSEKLADLVDLVKHDFPVSKGLLLNDLSDICWLLNLRGQDIAFNPVFLAYLAYDCAKERFTLFTHYQTMSVEAREALEAEGIVLRPYDETAEAVVGYHGDYAALPYSFSEFIVDSGELPLSALRAVKDETEIAGLRLAMERDGVAMMRFIQRLEEDPVSPLTELTAARMLADERAAQSGYEQPSFETISAYAAHGAIVHYEPTAATDVPLSRKGLLLLDSGAQYDCGTTDITRTFALGELTAEERSVYTLVLKGHLALQRLRFPEGTNGLQLDTAARAPLWARGYDFGHGTGHGVGAHLCVHEGPHQIRKDKRPCTSVVFRPGMVVTDEPGIYVAGRFGVRIENVLLCREAETTPFGRFLRFEPLTLCPYDLRPADLGMLTEEEIEQLNTYHAEVRRRLLPLIKDEATRRLLVRACQPITETYA